jgi:hypothetical protein
MTPSLIVMFAAASNHHWPDEFDFVVTVGYLLLLFGVIVLGFASMSLHFRDYLRSLRRALLVINQYRLELPEWVRSDRPRCIEALGLRFPCTSDEVLAAYRRKVKQMHPDLGGDTKKFLQLQEHFQQAMALATRE